MIIWREYDSDRGEQIDFCCDAIKSVYGSLVSWDPAERKWCLLVRRMTVQHNPYTSQNVTSEVNIGYDTKLFDYCMFCGKNVYKDELRYDTTGQGWSGHGITHS